MVMEMFAGKLHAKVVHVDASAQFLGQLAGVTDPERQAQDHRPRVRRGVPGRGGKKLGKARSGWPRARSTPTWSSGGTKTKKATTIKSHHNVGGLPETLG
jgi:GMP synthase (glutamine-hydrolysing)